jgi:hypothetical protein
MGVSVDIIANDTHSQLYPWCTKYVLASGFDSTITDLPEGCPLLPAGGQKIVAFGNPTSFGQALDSAPAQRAG